MSTPAIDVTAIREQFPELHRQINGQPIVYLDSANSSLKPNVVIDAMSDFMRTSYAPINRSAYQLAVESTDAYEGGRTAVQQFINAPRASEVIFTKNATESLNLVAMSWGRANLAAGDVVVLTHMEHHANIVPWHMLVAERGIVLRWVPLTADGQLDLTELPTLLNGAKAFAFSATRINNRCRSCRAFANFSSEAIERTNNFQIIFFAQAKTIIKLIVARQIFGQ